ncbi:MAG: flagellar basal body rod protein FlgC [Deltaproteobacteria bacterium]|nr:flagellar basal body rod protein FlgC [Deltaproteobacteria bacterium]
MDLIQTIDIAAEGMTAQRTRLNVISANLANAHTTRTKDGTPYRRKTVIFEAVPVRSPFHRHLRNAMDNELYGVRVREIAPVKGEFKRLFDPSHPDADENGYVYLPNVDYVSEMVSMLNASRSYEANASAIKTAKEMALKALEIGR